MSLAYFEIEPAQNRAIIFQHNMFLDFNKTEHEVSSSSVLRCTDPLHVADTLPGKSVFIFLIYSNVPIHRHNAPYFNIIPLDNPQ